MFWLYKYRQLNRPGNLILYAKHSSQNFSIPIKIELKQSNILEMYDYLY